jgi:hypothetical protein
MQLVCNMWKVFTRTTSASDFFSDTQHIQISYLKLGAWDLPDLKVTSEIFDTSFTFHTLNITESVIVHDSDECQICLSEAD